MLLRLAFTATHGLGSGPREHDASGWGKLGRKSWEIMS